MRGPVGLESYLREGRGSPCPECLRKWILLVKEHHANVKGVWIIGQAELGANGEPQRERAVQPSNHRGQKTGPYDSGQPRGPQDSAVPSGTWALVGKLRQGDTGSRGPPGLARSLTPTPTPAAVGLDAPGLLLLLPSLHAPSSHPTSGLLLDSPAAHLAFLAWGLSSCYSGSQESTLPGAHFVCGCRWPSAHPPLPPDFFIAPARA